MIDGFLPVSVPPHLFCRILDAVKESSRGKRGTWPYGDSKLRSVLDFEVSSNFIQGS